MFSVFDAPEKPACSTMTLTQKIKEIIIEALVFPGTHENECEFWFVWNQHLYIGRYLMEFSPFESAMQK